MRLLLFSGNYPPEIGPNARIVGEIASGMAARGHQVRVVTALPNHPEGVIHPGFQGRLVDRRTEEGVEVVRTWLLTGARRTASWRLAGALSWGLTGLAAALAGPRPDVVLGLSTPYPSSLFGVLAAALLGRPHVLYVQDLYPQTLEALGYLRGSLVRRAAYALQDWQHRRSARTLVIAREFASELERRGVEGLEVLPNWVDVERFSHPPGEWDFRAQWGLGDRLAVVFAGTLGAAQGLEVVLEAAHLLRRRRDLLFVLVGEGVARGALEDRARREGLENVVFRPPVPFSAMPDLLEAADISLVVLKDEPVFGLTLPCKTYELMAAGRPVAASAGRAVRTLVEEAGAGLWAPPGDGAGLADLLDRLAGDAPLRLRLGEAGRAHAGRHCRKEAALERLEGILSEAAGRP